VILILALHYTPEAVNVLRARLGAGVEVRGVALLGLSAAYVTLAQQIRCPGGELLAPLAHRLGASLKLDDYEAVFLVTWSAAYAYARELLGAGVDADKLTGWISLDSGYAGKDHDGTAADAQVTPFLELVGEAADGAGALVWAGYTDVATVPSVASTGAFWREVVRLSGREPRGLFRIDHWPGARGSDHVAARDTHGPGFVADALEAWRASTGSRPTLPTLPEHDDSPAPSIVEVARRELAAGVCEVPAGSNDGPALRGYAARLHAAGGTWSPGWAWCAMFVWACADTAGIKLPPVVAVHVLVEWAIAEGRWRDRDVIPAPGWLAVYRRAGADPRHGGEGHVEIVESFAAPEHSGIGGNVGNAVARSGHSLAIEPRGDELAGWIDLY
jgi:hypothetical protein